MIKILTIDPSLSCSGWAVLEDDASAHGNLLAAGTIPGDSGRPMAYRLRVIHQAVHDLRTEHQTARTYVEGPRRADHAGSLRKMNPTHLASYGMAVCAALLGGGPDSVLVPTDLWARHPAIPYTRRDPDKTGRVREAAGMYGRRVQDFGPVSVAGNVADAVLLGWWVLRGDPAGAKALI